MLNIYLQNAIVGSLKERYNKRLEIYKSDKKTWSIILQDRSIFEPFGDRPIVWEINELEKLCICNKDVVDIIKWANENIVLKLGQYNYVTIMVLIRILTGMINKLSISDEYKITLHDNVVKNIRAEYYEIQTSELPF